jgi:alpha-tubulin suppressor-like RCC1 family protein
MNKLKKRYHAIVGLAAMLTVMLIPTIPLNAASDSSSKELTEITHVEMGGSYALALDKQGVVWAWGANFNGQLGDGTTGFKSAAVPVFSDANKIQATSGYSLVLKKDGTIWFWGGNGNRVSGLDNFETKDNVLISSPA